MTQIVDKRLKKMCDECHSHLDKPCAWLSLGNEYCTEIMDIQQELQRKDNIINELKNGIKELDNMFYETFRVSQDGYFSISEWELKDFTDKIKELEEKH